jgi:hypothetical protein
MCDLSLVYRDQGSYDKAIELGSEAFETCRRALGSEHENTLFAMAELAVTLHVVGRRRSASDFMQVCAAKSRDGLSPTRLDTLKRLQQAEDWRKELMSLGSSDKTS